MPLDGKFVSAIGTSVALVAGSWFQTDGKLNESVQQNRMRSIENKSRLDSLVVALAASDARQDSLRQEIHRLSRASGRTSTRVDSVMVAVATPKPNILARPWGWVRGIFRREGGS